MKKKIITAMTCALIFASIPCITSFASQWKQDDTGTWYEHDNGSYVKNGWLEDSGKWYHFDSNGYMQKSEWVMDSGKWYYLGADGACLVNTTTPDNYTVGSDGARIFQMPATGLPTLESLKLMSSEEKYAFVSELYSSFYSSGNEGLWKLEQYVQMIPEDMNEIVTDADYYHALCDHVLKKLKNTSLADSMSSHNPAVRIYGYCMEEYRQIYIKYLALLSKNLKNGQYASYLENIRNLEKEVAQLEERYAPYMSEIGDWYSSLYYYDYYDYGYDYGYDYSYDYDYSY